MGGGERGDAPLERAGASVAAREPMAAPPRRGLQAVREEAGGKAAAGSAGRCRQSPGRAE